MPINQPVYGTLSAINTAVGSLTAELTPWEFVRRSAENAEVSSTFTVPGSAPYKVRMPVILDQSSVVATVATNARTIISGNTAGTGQIAINKTTGVWSFNAADEGLTCAYTVTPYGTVVSADFAEWVQVQLRETQAVLIDGNLTDIAGISPTDGVFLVGNGTAWVGESGATARTSIGVGSIATQAADAVAITGGTIAGATINNAVIGGTTAAAGTFSTLGGTTITATTGFIGPQIGPSGDADLMAMASGALTVNGTVTATGAAESTSLVLTSGPLTITDSISFTSTGIGTSDVGGVPTFLDGASFSDDVDITGNLNVVGEVFADVTGGAMAFRSNGGTPELFCEGDGAPGNIRLVGFRDNVNITSIVTVSARGSKASPSALLADDEVFRVVAQSYNGTSNAAAARILGLCPSNHTGTNRETRWDFQTTPNTSTTPRVTLQSHSNGALGLPVTVTPANASATGTTGMIAWDANYIYVCTATNTWKRVAIATW